MIFFLCFLSIVSFIPDKYLFKEQTFEFVEINSNKKAIVNVRHESNDIIKISVNMGLLKYNEIMEIKNDTIFLLSRNIKVGFLRTSINYKPKRIRIILPLKNDTIVYNGNEIIFGKNVKIKNITISHYIDNVYSIESRTIRSDKDNVSVLKLSKNGDIMYISFYLPSFMKLYKLLGFNSNKLIFKNNENR